MNSDIKEKLERFMLDIISDANGLTERIKCNSLVNNELQFVSL